MLDLCAHRNMLSLFGVGKGGVLFAFERPRSGTTQAKRSATASKVSGNIILTYTLAA
jgi:hypothetical protein